MTYRNYVKVPGIIEPWQPEGVQILFYLEFKLSPSICSSHFTLCMEGALWRTLYIWVELVMVLHFVLLEKCIALSPFFYFFSFPLYFFLSFPLFFPRIMESITENPMLKGPPSRSFGPKICGKGSLGGIN